MRVGVACALLLWAAPARGLGVDDVAGTLNGEPVTLGEVDEALGGVIRRQWSEMHEVARAAALASCGERALAELVAEAGISAEAWRAKIWSTTRPTDSDVAAAMRERPELFAGSSVSEETERVAHRLHVTRYRHEVARRTKARLSQTLEVHLPEPSGPPDAEPVLPEPVASCLGESVTAAEVKTLAAFPLYRRRAAVVLSTCRQFDIDYSNPLVLHRMAKAQGVSVEELRKGVDGSLEDLSEEEVAASALAHYGSTDRAALVKARIALEAQRRLPGRMAFLEGIRQGTTGACALSLPPQPDVEVRGRGGTRGARDGLRVVLFANFRCRHCRQSFEIAERLAKRFPGRLRLELRHHFPDTYLPPFEDALAATCSEQRGVDPFAFAQARWGQEPAGPSDPRLEACLRDPRTAVRVLEDTQEALRLGFREAMPSWVVGLRPRKGFQGEAILAETVAAQLAETPQPDGLP